jgi:hypothetical protein
MTSHLARGLLAGGLALIASFAVSRHLRNRGELIA